MGKDKKILLGKTDIPKKVAVLGLLLTIPLPEDKRYPISLQDGTYDLHIILSDDTAYISSRSVLEYVSFDSMKSVLKKIDTLRKLPKVVELLEGGGDEPV